MKNYTHNYRTKQITQSYYPSGIFKCQSNYHTFFSLSKSITDRCLISRLYSSASEIITHFFTLKNQIRQVTYILLSNMIDEQRTTKFLENISIKKDRKHHCIIRTHCQSERVMVLLDCW